MQNYNSKLKITFFLALFFWGVVPHVQAAVLQLVPEKQNMSINEEFTVEIRVDTEEQAINATQATVLFPNDVLELVSESRTGSTFSFWVEEPTISNENGTLSFIGGTAQGVSGNSLKVLTLNFKAKGTGTAELSISDAVVTASDGKGTNILGTVQNTNIQVGTTIVESETPTPSNTTPVVSEQPKKVERTAVQATTLPETPNIRVPLYSNQSEWYSQIGDVIALWDLPDDVTQVSASLSQSKVPKSEGEDEELYTGKNLGKLSEEGIWYVQVRFRNNKGRGDPAYYEIKLDTTPPLPFSIEMDDTVSDNPSPTVRHESGDSLSGIREYILYVNGEKVTTSTSTTTVLPPQSPGVHTLTARAFDKAGNSVEDEVEFEILPLPTPTIDFVTRSVSQGEFVFASGEAIPNSFIDVTVTDKNDKSVYRGFSSSGESGKWEIIIDKSLPRASYMLQVTVRDDRGALSYPTEPQSFRVKAKTIVALGPLELGWFEIVIMFILLVASGTGIATWYHVQQQQKREAYTIIAIRDVVKLVNLLASDISSLEEWFKDVEMSDRAKVESSAMFKRANDTMQKMKKYLTQELGKLK